MVKTLSTSKKHKKALKQNIVAQSPKKKKKKSNKRKEPEHDLQCKFVKYLEKYPQVNFCASIAGVPLGPRLGKKCKDKGLVKGYPDFYIYDMRGPHGGLFIEFKSPFIKAKARKSQQVIIDQLKEKGYKVVVCNDFDDARKKFKEYMRLPTTKEYYKKKYGGTKRKQEIIDLTD